MTSLTFQQKQNKYVPNYKLVQSFDPPCEHQLTNFSNTSPFSIHGIAKSSLCACNAITFIQMIQNSYQRAHDAGLDLHICKSSLALAARSPIWQLHWNNKGYIEHGIVQSKATCPLLWQSPILPGNDFPNCLLGEQDLAPSRRGFHSNNQDFTKQALTHCISTLTSKALAIECMGSKYKTHEELDRN